MNARLALATLLCAVPACRAQQDGGGKDVRIALFSARPVHSVVVTAAGPGAWWATCANCQHRPLTTALQMPAIREIVAGGPVTVRDEEHAQLRSANGKWHLRAETPGIVDVVLTLPSERYVAAVLLGETLPGDPIEYLRSMAVVARTFALGSPRTTGASDRVASDVCDSTACQAMKLGPVSSDISEAVRSTSGETLWFASKRAQVFFSANCGGTTEGAGAVWPKLTGEPYLRSISDPYCVRKDRAYWHAEVPIGSLQELAAKEGWRLPVHIASAQVTERTASQRAKTITFSGKTGERASVSASSLQLGLGRSLGWNNVRSDAYDLHVRNGMLVFDGHGHGHGVGFCQQGAAEMARQGKPYREVLGFYFRGTTVRVLKSDEGWKQSSPGSLRSLSTFALTPMQVAEVSDAWKVATQRFAPRQQIKPTITFAPSTELFRQMTSQPGWQLASTSGTDVVLQPPTVFMANRVSLQTTLQHELLHVSVESIAHAKAPLWLREGLVEVLAGDASHAPPSLSVENTEQMLQHAGSQQESEAAHVAAGARTRLLVERYGISAVRGLLSAGSPVPAD